jgi:hypothetical protein
MEKPVSVYLKLWVRRNGCGWEQYVGVDEGGP